MGNKQLTNNNYYIYFNYYFINMLSHIDYDQSIDSLYEVWLIEYISIIDLLRHLLTNNIKI